MADTSKKLGLGGLVAIVFGSMIGGGIFNISQNMAQGAGLGATLISWVISGVGVLFLVLNFKVLADARPDLNAGIYQNPLLAIMWDLTLPGDTGCVQLWVTWRLP